MGDGQSTVRGLSRRDFLAYCGSLAMVLGLGELGIPAVAAAIEAAYRSWLEGRR